MSAVNAKYLAVADTLKCKILNGKYESRKRFPSEKALVRRFGVSRPTVERVLRELKRVFQDIPMKTYIKHYS